MKPAPNWLQRLALLISTLGHPLLLGALFMVVATFHELPLPQAMLLSGLLLSGLIGPITWQNYRRVRKGQYTNFDVSDRQQRYRFYPTVLLLATVITVLLFATGQPKPIRYGLLSVLLLLATAYGVNFVSKLSLHAAVAFFLVWPTLLLSFVAGLWMAAVAVLIAISRLFLRRHTLSEVVQGTLLGVLAGGVFYLSVHT